MINFLNITMIILSILVIVIVLIQNKNVSLNLTSMWWGMWPVTKRGSEKVLHNATIILWTLFILNAIALFLLK